MDQEMKNSGVIIRGAICESGVKDRSDFVDGRRLDRCTSLNCIHPPKGSMHQCIDVQSRDIHVLGFSEFMKNLFHGSGLGFVE